MKITFDLSKPFLPFQQLMAVLPAASKELLPPALQVRNSMSCSKILLLSYARVFREGQSIYRK